MLKRKNFLIALLLIFSAHWAQAQYNPATDKDVLAAVEQNGKWGYIDRTGSLKIPLLFDDAGGFTEAVAPVRVYKTWGYIDRTGKFKLNPVFMSAANFHDGRALIQFKDPADSSVVFGFINHKGEMIIELQYNENASNFQDGLARIRLGMGNDQFFGFRDTMGKWVIPARYNYAMDFKEGLAPVGYGEKWGFMDSQQHVIVPPVYDMVFNFNEGLAWAQLGTNSGFIDKKGNSVFQITHGSSDFMVREGMVGIMVNGKMGFLDNTGKQVIAPQYDNPSPSYFSEGYAPVAIKSGKITKWGFINKKGILAISAKFDEVQPFAFGLAAAKLNGKYGFIDYTGKWVVKPQYDKVIGYTAYY